MENNNNAIVLAKNNEIYSILDNQNNIALTKRVLGENNSFNQELLSVLVNDEKLCSCKPQTIFEGALQIRSLGLSFNKVIGDAYLIPYENKKYKNGSWIVESYTAQVQISYKGIKKLLLRNHNVKKISECFVKEGEIKFYGYGEEDFDLIFPNDKEITVKMIDERNKKETIGYAVIIELKDGTQLKKFWSKEKCKEHGLKYSKTVETDKESGITYFKKNSQWSTNFDNMAMKTVMKKLAKDSGLLGSLEEKAIEIDQSVIEDEKYKYVDNPTYEDEYIEEENIKYIKPANTIIEVEEKKEENIQGVFIDDSADF